MIDELIKRDIRVLAYDPLAIENTRNIFGSQVEYVHSVESCLAHVNLAVITLRNPQIKKAVESFVAKNPLTIIDCWRMIDADRLNKTLIKYVPIGRYLEED